MKQKGAGERRPPLQVYSLFRFMDPWDEMPSLSCLITSQLVMEIADGRLTILCQHEPEVTSCFLNGIETCSTGGNSYQIL